MSDTPSWCISTTLHISVLRHDAGGLSNPQGGRTPVLPAPQTCTPAPRTCTPCPPRCLSAGPREPAQLRPGPSAAPCRVQPIPAQPSPRPPARPRGAPPPATLRSPGVKSAWNCGVCSLMAPASPRRHRRGGSSRSRALQGRRSRSAHIGHGRPSPRSPAASAALSPGPAALGPAAASGLAPPGAQRRRPAPPGTEGRERPRARPHRGGRGPVTACCCCRGSSVPAREPPRDGRGGKKPTRVLAKH